MTTSIIRGKPLSEDAVGALTLGGFLREVCAANAAKEAMVYKFPDDTVVRLNYSQVLEEALTVARALVARGVTKDTRVGLMVTNRPEWVTAMFGIALTGATCVALSTFGKGPELEYQLRVADVSLLIFERAVLNRDFAKELVELCPDLGTAKAPMFTDHLPHLRRAVCIGDAPTSGAFESWKDFLHGGPLASVTLINAMSAEIAPTDRGFIFFSSGSTAKPKAIQHTHRAAALQCWRWRNFFAIDPNVRTWTANGFFWSGNFAMAIGATFAAGGCLVLQSNFAPGEALGLIQSERVSLPLAWPHQWPRLVDDPAYATTDLSSLRYVGETSPLRAHPTVKSNWQEPMSAYGSTETFTLVTVYPSGTPAADAEGNNGLPVSGNTIRVVDPLSGQVVPLGQAGEIAVKGPTLMIGYLRMPIEETFDEEGFFRTGDGGFIDERGRLHWQGRLNDIIKTGGANVSPLEINSVLVQCPGIKIAATVGIPHDTLGEMVVACVVPGEGADLSEQSVRAFAATQLSSYKLPRRVIFLQESELEMTSSNKIKTAQLRELASKRLAAS
ncbi:class I adenylate-forming enzyme family protein [Stenotrophobium rhamnosiphilum]|uniref:AMP-dependent synthetase n=1 Tax=Stenotrophobium rhamnosiphilum TaxID=2029166 RepID=A0A2T5MCZ5_9GAMM|nr:class I adenylate-forming enzyme family protein [Stenotrophobium rhamnosiphilum]PTU30452.1 AMP-dependent synthetase [Stenotrophobium rhamnosiphilum]